MKYNKSNAVSGEWAKGSELAGVSRAKIVSETLPQPSQFLNKNGTPKDQDVCKIRFEGKPEPLNISLNKATINGLIDAFGEESTAWIGKVLSVETEKVRVAGVARVAIYLIPEGYEKVDNEEGFAVIQKIGEGISKSKAVKDMGEIPVIDDSEDEEIDVKDIPF